MNPCILRNILVWIICEAAAWCRNILVVIIGSAVGSLPLPLRWTLQAQSSSSTGFIGAATLDTFVFERTPSYIETFCRVILYRLARFLKQIYVNIIYNCVYIYICYIFIDLPRRLNESLTKSIKPFTWTKFATNKPQEMIRHWQRYCWGWCSCVDPKIVG